MRSLSFNTRRGLATLAMAGALALSATACNGLSGLTGSDSDACSKHLSGGNVTTCFDISDVSTSKGGGVVLIGASVKIVCKSDATHVGIVIPKSIVNADLSQVEWKTKSGANAARGIDSSYFSSVPSGLADCDKVLHSA